MALKVHVGSQNPLKAEAVRRVFSRILGPVGELEVSLVKVEPGVPKEPFGEEIALGAVRRAKEALKGADFGVGIEAGLVWNEALQVYFDVQFCAILDQEGRLTVGHGSGFVYPPKVIEEVVKKGRAVGEVMSELTGIPEIGRKAGSVGYLSKGALTRTELTEQAVLAAMIPRIRPELY
ncbi:MAG: inosine/xanthosine triphosphatase [Candidatus Bipolaricaulia bacterium]